LFDKICRHNGIAHRLTEPASPTTTGKVERFHLTLRRELLDHVGPFTSIEAAQAAVDAWVAQYNAERPHQALDAQQPADRFVPAAEPERELLPVWLPPTLVAAPTFAGGQEEGAEDDGGVDHDTGEAAGRGRVGRSSWTRSCRRQGTCGWSGNSSGSAPPGPDRRFAS
jgi:hypothetical protein